MELAQRDERKNAGQPTDECICGCERQEHRATNGGRARRNAGPRRCACGCIEFRPKYRRRDE